MRAYDEMRALWVKDGMPMLPLPVEAAKEKTTHGREAWASAITDCKLAHALKRLGAPTILPDLAEFPVDKQILFYYGKLAEWVWSSIIMHADEQATAQVRVTRGGLSGIIDVLRSDGVPVEIKSSANQMNYRWFMQLACYMWMLKADLGHMILDKRDGTYLQVDVRYSKDDATYRAYWAGESLPYTAGSVAFACGDLAIESDIDRHLEAYDASKEGRRDVGKRAVPGLGLCVRPVEDRPDLAEPACPYFCWGTPGKYPFWKDSGKMSFMRTDMGTFPLQKVTLY